MHVFSPSTSFFDQLTHEPGKRKKYNKHLIRLLQDGNSNILFVIGSAQKTTKVNNNVGIQNGVERVKIGMIIVYL